MILRAAAVQTAGRMRPSGHGMDRPNLDYNQVSWKG